MKLVIASNNSHKIAEIKEILKGKFEEMYSLEEMGIDCDPEENGATFLAAPFFYSSFKYSSIHRSMIGIGKRGNTFTPISA